MITHESDPIEVFPLDMVGYVGEEEFVIINPVKSHGRVLPVASPEFLVIPYCIKCFVMNNQLVNFAGQVATLHDIDGQWHYKMRKPGAKLELLQPFTFFEIGSCA